MKKKSKKSTSASAPKKQNAIGGRQIGGSQGNWARVGRQRRINDSPVMHLAQELKALREERGISITKMAKELEIAPATLIKFEDRGHAVSIAIVTAIAEELDHKLELRKAGAK